MHAPPLLRDLVVIALVAVVVVGLLVRLRIPTLAGLIVAGALAGPFGLGVVQDRHSLDTLAEVGVALLLFTVGLEFSLRRLARIVRLVVVGGLLQVVATTLAVAAAAYGAGEGVSRALFFGFVLALSSTAIVLKALAERGEVDSPHGRFVVGVLIFQDLAVVFMMLLIPAMEAVGIGGALGEASPGDPWLQAAGALARAAGIVAATLLLSRAVVPRLFRFVTAARSRELFLLTVAAVLAATVWVSSLAGLSMALGAFLAGLMLADTEFRHRALGDIIPFRDLLTSLFFLSLGMMADIGVLAREPGWVVALVVFLVVGKGLIGMLAALAMRFPARVAWLAGAAIGQFSEFGFILLGVGAASGFVVPEEVRILVASGVISMLVTPLVMRAAPHLSAGQVLLRPLERLLGVRGIDEGPPTGPALRGHVVVVGFGVAGRVVARALADAGVPFLVLELNAETVRAASAAGEAVYYGDAAHPESLRHARLPDAQALVILINDPDAVNRIVATARECAPEVPILVRTRYLADRKDLSSLGATEVVVDEVEAGIEVLCRVLRLLGVPQNQVAAAVDRAHRTLGSRPSEPPKETQDLPPDSGRANNRRP